jgi:hypothetical protein
LTAILSPPAKIKEWTAAGKPANGYKLYTYAANTTNLAPTYSNRGGTVANTNPVVLDARGEAIVYLDPAVVYDFVLKTDLDVTVWTREDVTSSDYDIRSDLASTIANYGAALVGWIASGVGAVARTVLDKMRDRASLLDYIPTAEHAAIKAGTSVYDCKAAVLAAVTAHKRVYVPEGLYPMTGTVAIPVGHKLYGDSGQASRFSRAGSDLSFFVLGTNAEVHSIGFTRIGATTATSGRLIDIQVSGCRVSDIYCDHAWDAIYVTSCAGLFLDRLYLNNWQNSALRIDGVTNDVYLDTFLFTSGATGAGFRLNNKCEALIASNGDVIGGVYSMITSATSFLPGAASIPGYCKFTNVFFDSATTGVWLDKCADFRFTSCWFSSRPGNGLTVNQCYDVACTNCEFVNCGAHGALLNSTLLRGVSFVGCSFMSNNQAVVGGNGLTVGAGVSDWSAIGCLANNTVIAANTQGYGIYVTAGASDYYVVQGNNLRGNGTGGMFDGGTGANKRVGGNAAVTPAFTGIGTAGAPAFANSWVNFDAGTNQQAGFWKDDNGLVHLRGLVKSGVVGSVMFTLPAGFRPSALEIFAVPSNALFGVLYVASNGDVTLNSGSNTYASLAGVTFLGT